MNQYDVYNQKIDLAKKFIFYKKFNFIDAHDIVADIIVDGVLLEDINYNHIKYKVYNYIQNNPIHNKISQFKTKNKTIIGCKTCFKCKQMLSEVEFGVTLRKNGSKEIQSYCLECQNEYGKIRWAEIYSKDSFFKQKMNLRRKKLYEKQKQNFEFVNKRRSNSKKYYDEKKNDPEWKAKQKERFRAYRLKKKNNT